jgi:hypothetical protein
MFGTIAICPHLLKFYHKMKHLLSEMLTLFIADDQDIFTVIVVSTVVGVVLFVTAVVGLIAILIYLYAPRNELQRSTV